MSKLRIDIWSDIACPWCYVGKRRLEAALERFPHRAEVEIVWRAFELDPAAPRERDPGVPYAERLAKKYGSSVAQAEARIARTTELAAAEGLTFRFDRIRAGNTFDANRVVHLAGERGVQDAVKERLLLAYMTEGEPIGDREALARLAGEAGLDADEVRAMLAGDAYADDVRRDEQEAGELGIDGVPFFVLAGRYGLSGAQPADVLLRALTVAWDEVSALPFQPADALAGAAADALAGAAADAPAGAAADAPAGAAADALAGAPAGAAADAAPEAPACGPDECEVPARGAP